jgi:hypothetical protein
MDVLYAYCAGLDIHKKTVSVCVDTRRAGEASQRVPLKRLTSRNMVHDLWAYPGDARENTRHRRIASCFNALCNIGLFSKRER